MEWTTTLPVLGISAGAGLLAGLGAAWLGLKAFASKWLDHRFASKLEALKLEGQHQIEQVKLQAQNDIERSKQEHTNQIELLRYERANLLDRDAKLNQREFEIIPEIWRTITASHVALVNIISVFREGVDVGRMEEPQFDDFIANSRLRDWQKEEIKRLNRFGRTTYYSAASAWFRLEDASIAITAMNNSILNSSIFLHPDTYKRVEKFAETVRYAFHYFKLRFQMGEYDRAEIDPDNPVSQYRLTGSTEYDALAAYLRERYWIKPTDSPAPDA